MLCLQSLSFKLILCALLCPLLSVNRFQADCCLLSPKMLCQATSCIAGAQGSAACLNSRFLVGADEGKFAFCLCRRGLEYRLTVLFLASCVLPSLAVLALPVYASNHKVGTHSMGSFWCPVWCPAWQCSPSHNSHQMGAPLLTLLLVSQHLLSLAVLTLPAGMM